jgi:dihydrofolate reductase
LIEDPVPAPEGWLILEGDHEPPEFEMWQTPIAGKNYEGFAAYWPSAAGDGRWADMLNPMPKWVASTTLTAPLEWNATLIEGDVAEAVQRLKDEHNRDLISSGCGAFARFLVEHGLVDELMFWIDRRSRAPVIGRSTRVITSTSNSSAHKASSQRLSCCGTSRRAASHLSHSAALQRNRPRWRRSGGLKILVTPRPTSVEE